MATESPQLSKTERNLWNAIVSEALANLKYNAYAHKALEEGLPEVAQVFQEVAGAETIHGIITIGGRFHFSPSFSQADNSPITPVGARPFLPISPI